MLETEIARLKETDADRLRGEYDRLVQGLRDARYETKKKSIFACSPRFLNGGLKTGQKIYAIMCKIWIRPVLVRTYLFAVSRWPKLI